MRLDKFLILPSLFNYIIVAYFLLLGSLLIWTQVFAFGVYGPSDFRQDYGAGLALLNGESIYGDYITSWAKTLSSDIIIENFHPPFVAILMTPFARLSYVAAVSIFLTVSFLIYAYIVVSISNRFNLRKPHKICVLALFILWPPFISNTIHAQFSVYLSALILFSGLRVTNKDSWIPGVLLAIASMIKMFPLAFLFYFFIIGRFKAFISMILTLAVLSFLTFFIVGAEDTTLYLTSIMFRNSTEWSGYPINQSFLGFINVFLSNSKIIAHLTHLQFSNSSIYFPLAILIVLLTGIKAKMLFVKGNQVGSYCLFTTGILIASPISWSHVFLILLLPVAYLLFLAKNRICLRSYIVITLAFISFPDLPFFQFVYRMFSADQIPWYVVLTFKFPFYGLICLYFLLSNLPANCEKGWFLNEEKVYI